MIRFSANEAARLGGLLSGFEGQMQPDEIEDRSVAVTGGYWQEKFRFTGLSEAAQKLFLLRWFCSTGFVVSVALLITSIPVAILLACLMLWLCFRSIQSRGVKRAAEFEKDYTAFLLSFASSVRTGLDPVVAFYSCGKLFEEGSLIRVELERFRSLLESGVREEEVLRDFARTVDLPNLSLLRTAVILARQEGASLADCLRRLAKVTRQRQSFRRKIKAALAMQRLSAFGISGCAIVIGVFQVITNPEGIGVAFGHSVGRYLLLGGAGLMMLGLVWMLHLAKPGE